MWLMIFGVILYYVGLVNHRYIHHTFNFGFSNYYFWYSMLVICRILIKFFGNIQYSIFYSPLASSEIVSILIQLLFAYIL